MTAANNSFKPLPGALLAARPQAAVGESTRVPVETGIAPGSTPHLEYAGCEGVDGHAVETARGGTVGGIRQGVGVAERESVVDEDEIFDGYLSDLSDDIEDRFPNADEDSDAEDWLDEEHAPSNVGNTLDFIDPALLAEDAANLAAASSAVPAPVNPADVSRQSPEPHTPEPARKRRKLDIPARQARELERRERLVTYGKALDAISKLIVSRKTKFQTGEHGLQARRARAIESCLHIVVKDKEKWTPASEKAAQANKFAPEWGGRLVRVWTKKWIKERSLPESDQGQHAKVLSIFDDPTVRAEISAYMRSEKWSLNPPKLKKFFNKELDEAEGEAYGKELFSNEMPRGLKAYVEEKVLPRLHLKPSRWGLSLSSMRLLMLREGFWVPKGEQPLRKKGVGQGIHVSGFVDSVNGWMHKAHETLEYGKNHEGWWTGEHYIQQLNNKLFPVFRATYGPNAVAVILVDNSQGHCAYAEDALRVSRMNMRPGGKQACMRDGWYMRDGVKVSQRMVFVDGEHPDHKAGVAKGMQRVLVERGLFRRGMLMQCKEGCDDDATDCCATRTLSLQPDFKQQKSLVQETIEGAGHICIMLPKYHCEINFIEYFWGAVKRYLREHCDYTFNTLRANLPTALQSVSKLLIRKWEHRSWRFIDAYAGGLNAKDAQFQVKKYSSRTYASHRRIPERLAAALDA
ncbi:hypothetical protein PENSPDRAFT_632253 [Peniophora sp. CONT]|nr:hypothetical protein PENSPDRAFT_632253 [Peniophora sp. CONT]